jgi:hypothetical protein
MDDETFIDEKRTEIRQEKDNEIIDKFRGNNTETEGRYITLFNILANRI